MGATGKKYRLNRLLNASSNFSIIVPIDHGFTRGPILGLESITDICEWIGHPIIRGVLAHKGMIERLGEMNCFHNKGVIIHLNGMISTFRDLAYKVQLTSIQAAMRRGADAVSIDLHFDGENDARNMQLLGEVVDEADQYGVPVLAMISDKGADDDAHIERLRHFIRSSIELGASAIKVACRHGTAALPQLLNELVRQIPVFLAGGELISDKELVEFTRTAIDLEAAGLCIGRNIFQHKRPEQVLDVLAGLIERQPLSAIQ